MSEQPQMHTGVVDFDLDAATREHDEVIRPFAVNFRGKVITMTDPAEIDWQDLLTIHNPADFLRHCVSEEDRRHIRKQRGVEGWRFGELMDAYMTHYKLEEKLRRAQADARL